MFPLRTAPDGDLDMGDEAGIDLDAHRSRRTTTHLHGSNAGSFTLGDQRGGGEGEGSRREGVSE